MDNARRLERLDKALEVMGLPERELPMLFDMDFYGDVNPKDDETGEPLDCGSAGCFAGEISLHPWFRQRGLAGWWDEEGHLRITPKGKIDISFGMGWQSALANFFGISKGEAVDLVDSGMSDLDSNYLNRKWGQFSDDGETPPPITQAHVRARLRRLIARYSD